MLGQIKSINESINTLEEIKKDINANNFVEAINGILRVKTFLKNLSTEQKKSNQLSSIQKSTLDYIIKDIIPSLQNFMSKRNQPEIPIKKEEILRILAYITDQIKGIRVTLR